MSRRVPRFPCEVPAEVTADGAVETANVTELSRYGCFVETPEPLETGTSVVVKIMNQGQVFAAMAMVVYTRPDLGMGIAFREVKSLFQGVLDTWLSDLVEKRSNDAK
jgi:positive regulator of sigma E activity